MTTDLETISQDEDALEALTALHRTGIGRLIVTDVADLFPGPVTRPDVVTALNVGFVRSAERYVGVPEPEEGSSESPRPVNRPRW